MNRVLITGISGFIGKNLVNYFKGKSEVELYGHSRNSAEAKKLLNHPDVSFIHDLSAETIDKNRIDTIVHLAGIAHDLSGKYKSRDYINVNYEKTKELFDAFVKSHANSFVFVSSIKAVVDHTDGILDENIIPIPTSDYGMSKLKAEQYIVSNAPVGKKYIILRPSMVHGPGNKGNLNLLYKFVKTGIPYPLGAFENKRSFLTVDNFCFVIQKILVDELKSGTYNLADDDPISTNELIGLIAEGINKKPRIIRVPKKIILGLGRLGSKINAPFNTKILNKLCENMVVSNQKLLLNLKSELPVSTKQGLMKTIKSFNE